MQNMPGIDALLAQGVPIKLANGTTVPLRYSMLSLAKLERRFGSVSAAAKSVQRAAAQLAVDSGEANEEQANIAAGYDGAGIFDVLIDVLSLGLLFQRVELDGNSYTLSDEPELLGMLLIPSQTREYVNAFASAFREALDVGADESRPTRGVDAQTLDSLSQSGITSRAAELAGTTRLSGT